LARSNWYDVEKRIEETLIDRLKTVPEFAIYTQFTIPSANALARDTLMLRNQGRFRPETVPDPYLLRSGLPIIAGEACRLSDDAADALQTGSLFLRELLTGQARYRFCQLANRRFGSSGRCRRTSPGERGWP
jgi:hypothetical protein